MITRRSFLSTLGAGSAALLAACAGTTEVAPSDPSRLRFRGGRPSRGTPLGTDVLTDADSRRAYIQVPPSYNANRAAPLVIAFHGSGGRGTDWLAGYSDVTDAAGIILLAPDSLDVTWDALIGPVGTDVTFINAMLDQVFARCNIDTRHLGLIGFSDGASYALSLGLANGDQTRQIIAHSPGVIVPEPRNGVPAFFISHGTSDPVFPIDDTSRKIVPALRAAGEDVTYVEFDGEHEVPDTIASQAVAWMSQRFV